MKKAKKRISKILIIGSSIVFLFTAVVLSVTAGTGETIGGELIFITPIGYAWSLMNLVLCVSGGILALVILIRAVYILTWGPLDEKNAYIFYKCNGKERVRNRHICYITICFLGCSGVVLFLLTQDMSRPIALMDVWTLIHAVVFTTEIMIMSQAIKLTGTSTL